MVIFMFKKVFSLSLSLLTAAAVMPLSFAFAEDSVQGEYSQNGITLSYIISEDKAVITDCTGEGTSLVIPELVESTYPVAAVSDRAFEDCTTLVNITVPDSVTEISSYAFSGCSSLQTVYLGGGVSFIGDYAFASCSSLKTFDVDTENSFFSSSGNMLMSYDKTSLVCYAGGASAAVPEGTLYIEKGAFFGNTSVTGVTLPSGLDSVGDYAFAGCLSLKSVTLPASVSSLGKGAFMSCISLSQAVLGANLSFIPEECFSMCSSLYSVNFPSAVTELGSKAFYSCPQLTGIYIPATVTVVGEDAIGTHYDIRTGANAPIEGFYINGDKGSAIEQYAIASGVDFIDYSNIPLGDVDGNGQVTPSDAAITLSEYASVNTGNPPSFSEYQTSSADVNGDGNISPVDAALILEIYSVNATT